MDNLLPRYFHGGVCTFKLKKGVTQDQVLSMLRASLDDACSTLPFLTRRAFSIPPSPENPTVGRLEAREHADWKPVVEYKDLSDTWPDYNELVAEGLPQDMLDGSQLLPASRFQADLTEAGTPLLVAQANFVEGGLILGIAMFHALMDGMSMALIYRTWAQHMRMHQGEVGHAGLDSIPGAECFDYNTLVDVWKKARSPEAEPTPENWRMLGLLPPTDAGAGGLRLPAGGGSDETLTKPPPAMKTGIFYVSAAQIARLSTISTSADEPGATANDALMALLWRCVIRARKSANPSDPSYNEPGAATEMDTTLNGRALLSDVLPWQYMGTLVFYTMTRLTVEELVAPSTRLEDVVGAVRRSVAGVTRERALGGYGLAATGLKDFTAEALRRPMPTFEGAEFGITSLLSLPILDSSFGSQVFANGGIPDFFRQERRLFDQVCRYCSIGPLRREGGTEITVSLTVEEMDILESDIEFSQFAQLLCN